MLSIIPDIAATLDFEERQIARARAEVAAEARAKAEATPKPKGPPETTRGRLHREAVEKATARAGAILIACQNADKMELAQDFVSSDMPIEIVEYELAKAADQVH